MLSAARSFARPSSPPASRFVAYARRHSHVDAAVAHARKYRQRDFFAHLALSRREGGREVQEIISVSLLARSAPSDATGTTVEQAKEGAVTLMTTPMDVAGLGDAAYWINIGVHAPTFS